MLIQKSGLNQKWSLKENFGAKPDGPLEQAGMPTSHNSQGTVVNSFAATAQVEATPSPQQGSSAPLSVAIGRAYERFLEMPVAFVLGVMWLAGMALIGSCALVLYLVVSALI